MDEATREITKKATFALVAKDKKTMRMSFRGRIASSFKQTPNLMCNVQSNVQCAI